MFKLKLCPCGSEKAFDECCAIFLSDTSKPETPEQLMRSRYTAYTMSDIDYIEQTMSGAAAEGFNKLSVKAWADSIKWIRLKILSAELGTNENISYVEFIAYFREGGKAVQKLHEKSEFRRQDDIWYYVGNL